MIDQETIDACHAIMERRRAERRRFLRTGAGAVVAAGGISLLAACDDDDDDYPPAVPTPTPSPTATANDIAILNFALNLEYLEANYYSFGAFGTGISDSLKTGQGQQGAVTGGSRVTFDDAGVAAYIREIAADELAHVNFLRGQLGSVAVAQPAINIAGDGSGAFTAAALAAGVIGRGETFNPYASQDNFLLGAFLLEDVGVTAYKGAAQFINSKVFLEASAGILAVEAYHSGLLRTLLYRRGLEVDTIFTQVRQISDARDRLDGPEDRDQPIANNAGPGDDPDASNIVPADENGIVYGRTTGEVLNIAYLTASAASSGGFFPAGVNGTIRTSDNNAVSQT